MRLILVRHGQTTCNAQDIWHGWDDCELTEIGHRQAHAAAARLASEPVAAVYASDLPRAQQTAQAIAAPHELEPILDPGLRERNAGIYQGLLGTEVLARFPNLAQERAADYWGWEPPGGESMHLVLARALDAIDRLRARHPGETVVAVSHMGTTRALISKLAGIPIDQTFALAFPSTGVSIFRFDGNGVWVEALNDGSHIDALPS